METDDWLETSVLGEQLQKEYEQKYPNGPRYTPYLVAFINISEFKGYLGADIDVSKTIERIEKPLHEIFTRHLLNYHDQLNKIAKSVYEDHKQKITNKSCDTSDDLKSMIVKTINSHPGFKHSTQTSDKPRRDLVMNFLTEIQTILAPSVEMSFKPVRTENDLEDPWSPINLSLSFQLFCRLVDTEFRHGTIRKEDRLIDTYKQKYILHMSNAATTNEEFLLGIISAYGTDPRKYPSTVLRIMEEKKMLRDNMQDCRVKFPSTVGVDTPKSIDAPGTTTSIKPVTASTVTHPASVEPKKSGHLSQSRPQSPFPPVSNPVQMGQPPPQPSPPQPKGNPGLIPNPVKMGQPPPQPKGNPGLIPNPVKMGQPPPQPSPSQPKGNPVPIPNPVKMGQPPPQPKGNPGLIPNPVKMGQPPPQPKGNPGSISIPNQFQITSAVSTESESNTSSPSSVSSVPGRSTPFHTAPTSENNNTVTLKKFLEGATECWKLFYGNETTKQIPLTWYSNFSSQFPHPHNKDGILNICIEQLVRDKEHFKGVGQHKIPYLSDTISSSQFEEVKKELNSSIPKFPSIVPTSASGVELLMWNNKSQLQHAIIPPLSLEETQANKSKSVPRPDSWIPSLCMMPFNGFYAHAEWYLNRKKGKSQSNIKGLDPEIIKLRYVEYLSILHKHPNQFILGIFTAYGPNVLTYPLRVLQLMKSKDLLRKNTKLFDVIKVVAGKTYSRITPNPDSSPSPKQNVAAAADTAVVNGHIVPSTSFDRMEIDKQNNVKHKLDDPRTYPSTVFRIMEEKKMLQQGAAPCIKPATAVTASVEPKNSQQNDILSNSRSQSPFPSAAVTHDSIEQKVFQQNDSLSSSRSQSPFPPAAVSHASVEPKVFQQNDSLPSSRSQSPFPPVSMSTKSKSNSSSSSTISSVPSRSTPFPTSSTSENSNTVTLNKFLEGATECWRLFYGNETTKQIPLTWYSNFSSQFPHPNNTGGILTNCVDILVRDKENITRVGQYKIPCLSDTVSSAQFDEIQKELNSSIPKIPSIIPTSASGVELLMWNNKSQLQHAIIPPLSLEEPQGNRSKSVPRPDAWIPSFCVMPFHGFYAHAEWYLNHKKGKESNIIGLDFEIVKLRYVEYLSILHKHPNQFILGIFTAYGPHVLTYPLRVLQLMKSKDLLRRNTKLFDVIKVVPGKTHSKVLPNPGSPATPKQNGPSEAITAVVNGHVVVPSTSSDRMEFDKQNEVKHKLDERFPISNSFESWTNACNRTLMENCKGSKLNYEIPESYYRQLYTNYKEVLKNLKENNLDDYGFHLFALGVWGGICLNDFRKESISTSGIQSEFERQSAGTQTEKIQPVNNTELVGGKYRDGDIVHVPKYSGQLQLNKTALQTLANVGFEPDTSVESILTSFVSSKQIKRDAFEKIQDNFAGDKIYSFVKESACRMCWVSDEDEQKFTAALIKKLIKKNLVSKAHVIHDIKDSVIKHLPDLVVKVVNVTSNVAEFLSHLFKAEDDFFWFIILTTELSQSFIPVWSDLFIKTVISLKRRTSETAFMALFLKTPGSHEFLSASGFDISQIT